MNFNSSFKNKEIGQSTGATLFLFLLISLVIYGVLRLLITGISLGGFYKSIGLVSLSIFIVFAFLAVLVAFISLFQASISWHRQKPTGNGSSIIKSRVNRVAVELFNYQFNHNSSDLDSFDDSFIGRNKIMHRLEVLLTKSISKSGAYLITGFRGMGKTTLVSQALYKVNHKRLRRAIKYTRRLLVLLLLSIFDITHYWIDFDLSPTPYQLLIIWLPAIILLSSLIYMLHADNEAIRTNHHKKFRKFLKMIFIQNVKSFTRFLTREKKYKNNLLVLSVDFLIISITHWAVMLLLIRVIPCFTPSDSNYDLAYLDLTIVYVSIFLIISTFLRLIDKYYVFFNQEKKASDKIKTTKASSLRKGVLFKLKFALGLSNHDDNSNYSWLSREFLTKFKFFLGLSNHDSKNGDLWLWRKPLTKLKYFFNYSHRVHVRINLSKENLTDVDILKMISRDMLKKYQKVRTPFFTFQSFLGTLALLFITIIGVGLIYYNPAIYPSINEIRSKAYINEYLPSQQVFPWSEASYEKTIAQLIDEGKGINDETFNRYLDAYISSRDSTKAIIPKLPPNSGLFKSICHEVDLIIFLIYRKSIEAIETSRLINGQWAYLRRYKNQLTQSGENEVELSDGDSVLLRNTENYKVFSLTNQNTLNKYSTLRLDDFSERPKDTTFIVNKDITTGKMKLKGNSQTYTLRKPFLTLGTSGEQNNPLLRRPGLSPDFTIIPPAPDYLFFCIVLFTLFLCRYLTMYLGGIGIITNGHIYRRLKRLDVRIKSQVTNERGGRFGFSLGSLFSNQRKQYPIADDKEIESELISILEEVDRIPRAFVKPEFVFVFDELDKISPRFNQSIQDKEDAIPEMDNISEQQSIRQRQEMIYKILSNLKLFFTSSKAKFIFIAGREMYDSVLADISDRESNLDSIFHETLYVNSFFYDSYSLGYKDITGLTEEFVCQFLLPPNSHYERTIEGYYKYLIAEFKTEEADLALELKFQKVVMTLKNFVLYLTYRSNGAPKKLIKLFEQFIVCPRVNDTWKYKPIDENLDDFIGQNPRNLYLFFGFHDQYKFGLISSLFSPNIFSESLNVRNLGDKLMIAIAFLTDHLYKFHDNAFSWQHLELTPDIISVNRAPQLRGFIQNLINSLATNNLRIIINGLFEYKFNSRVSSEIAYISSISEPEAAAFNFTLDESLVTKRHYQNILERINKQKVSENFDSRQHHHSQSFVLMTIGDLHYYDQEYDDAIMYYLQATQAFRVMEPENMEIDQLVIYIRNMLKLGLAMEKKKTLDTAYMTYHKLTNLVVGLRQISFRKLNIHRSTVKHSNLREFVTKFQEDLSRSRYLKNEFIKPNSSTSNTEKVTSDPKRKFKRPTPDKLSKPQIETILEGLFTKTTELSFYGRINSKKGTPDHDQTVPFERIDKFLDFNTEFFHSLSSLADSRAKNEVLFKITQFEGFRLLYQPLLAKLQLIEKSNLGGITMIDYKRSIKEFNYLIEVINLKEKFLIQSEFYNKVGDILYYKNGYLFGYYDENRSKLKDSEELESNYPFKRPMTGKEIMRHKYSLLYSDWGGGPRIPLELIVDGAKFYSDTPKYFKPTISGYEQYIKSLLVIVKGIITPTDLKFISLKNIDYLHHERDLLKTILSHLIKRHTEQEFFFRGEDSTKSIANVLSDAGDAILCTISLTGKKANNISLDFLKCLFNIKKHRPDWEEIRPKINECSRLELVLVFYLASGSFYSKGGRLAEDSFQLTKILYTLKEYLAVSGNTKELQTIWSSNLKGFIKHILSINYRAQEGARTPEAHGLKFFDVEGDNQTQGGPKWGFRYTPLATENKELSILVEEIRLYLKPNLEINQNYCVFLANPYQSISNIFIRLKELRFKAKINHKVYFDKYENDGKRNINFESKKFDQEFSKDHLITDSILCLYEIINHLKVFGVSYLFNYSFFGSCHSKLAWWINKLATEQDSLKNTKYRLLQQELNPMDLETLNPEYHSNLALNYYKQALQMHNEGTAYKQQIRKMFYLDDDYNDNLYHFCAAIERYKINTGVVARNINKLSKDVKEPYPDKSSHEISQKKTIDAISTIDMQEFWDF